MRAYRSAAFLLGALAIAACSSELGNSDATSNEAEAKPQGDTAQSNFIKDHGTQAEWFKTTPFSSAGIPMILFRLFPAFAKDVNDKELMALWGETIEDLPALGLPRNTTDNKSHAVALGLGYIRTQKPLIAWTKNTPLDVTSFQVAGLTCGACHMSRIRSKGGDAPTFIFGNGNVEFDPNKFGDAIVRTVKHSRFTGEEFLKLIKQQNPHTSWEFNDRFMAPQQAIEVAAFGKTTKDESGQTVLVSDAIVKRVKDKVRDRQKRVDTELGKFYDAAHRHDDLHGGTPGQADALGKIAVIAGSHAFRASPVDLPAVWKQSDHTYSQYDGSIRDYFFRNIAATAGVSGVVAEEANRTPGCKGPIQQCTDQGDVNIANAYFLSKFVQDLPPPKYPFGIEAPKAKKGEQLFAQNCKTCHTTTGQPNTYRVGFGIDQGADRARATQLSSESIADIAAHLKRSCESGMQGFISNGFAVEVPASACNMKPEDILFDQTKTKSGPGYVGQALNGIWATAPYLHNGSVPNLRALLIPSLRPKKFWRGNITYDQQNLGWVDAQETTANKTSRSYSTELPGNTNRGHTGLQMLGKDWSAPGSGVDDLLEYLKTL